MTGGSIVGCSAVGLGGGVHLAYDSAIGKSSTFTLTGGSIIGCAAKSGGGVSISPGCTFIMDSNSEIRNCNAQSGGGGVDISALWNSNIIGRFIMKAEQSVHAQDYTAAVCTTLDPYYVRRYD